MDEDARTSGHRRSSPRESETLGSGTKPVLEPAWEAEIRNSAEWPARCPCRVLFLCISPVLALAAKGSPGWFAFTVLEDSSQKAEEEGDGEVSGGLLRAQHWAAHCVLARLPSLPLPAHARAHALTGYAGSLVPESVWGHVSFPNPLHSS